MQVQWLLRRCENLFIVMRIFSIVISLCIFISCYQRNTANGQHPTADTLRKLVGFTIKIPKDWRDANDDTLPLYKNATYTKRFHNSQNQLIYIISSPNPTSDFPINSDPQIILNEEIAGYKAKIFQPVIVGKGFSGVHFDSVGTFARLPVGLSIYGKNLDSIENALLLRVIKTISVIPNYFN